MLRIAYIIIFVFCVAAAAYGILMANDLRKKKNTIGFSISIFYQQILIYVFGFYGIWGHILSKLIFVNQVSSNSILERISFSITILAVPFLLLSWWFLVNIGTILFGFKRKSFVTSIILVASFVLTVLLLFLKQPNNVLDVTVILFIIENLFLAVYLILAVVLSKAISISAINKRYFVSVLTLFSVIITLCAFCFELHLLLAASFILFFFIANTWLSFSLRYLIKYPEIEAKDETLTYSSFCEKYGISKREAEIIELICGGLTNKEIADKLFVTLQTIKDHTSRIYLKTEVKNRTQLANLVRDKC